MTQVASELERIEAKVAAGRRLSREDGLALFATNELAALGRLADAARQRRHGLTTWYIANTHVNCTNTCINGCGFCAFARAPGDPEAYLLTPEEVVERAAPDVAAGATEVHVVGGLHPQIDADYYVALVSALREAFPRVSIQALTAVEVAYAADRSGLGTRELLRRLAEAGLTGLPGGGAEIFAPDVRRRICPRKISGRRWLDIHRDAHRLGLATNATMLYGHVEDPEHRVDHLLALRELQDETGGFLTFIPLAFHPEGTDFADRPGPTAWDHLRTMAASRLLLDNVPHLKAFWIMLTPAIAQVALRMGADDIDGTVVREEITHAAGASTPQGLSVEELRRLVREAGCEPVERDTLYRAIRRGPGPADWERGEP
jgi:aminodeoxyfutalosine synthase